MTNVVDCEFDALEIGMPLEVVFQETSEDVTIPVFRARGRGDGGSADRRRRSPSLRGRPSGPERADRGAA
jgi:hypothetical protein